MLDLYYKIFPRQKSNSYQIVYKWYEEKRDQCEMLRGQVELLQDVRDGQSVIIKQQKQELENAEETILGLRNELHAREVVNTVPTRRRKAMKDVPQLEIENA